MWHRWNETSSELDKYSEEQTFNSRPYFLYFTACLFEKIGDRKKYWSGYNYIQVFTNSLTSCLSIWSSTLCSVACSNWGQSYSTGKSHCRFLWRENVSEAMIVQVKFSLQAIAMLCNVFTIYSVSRTIIYNVQVIGTFIHASEKPHKWFTSK